MSENTPIKQQDNKYRRIIDVLIFAYALDLIGHVVEQKWNLAVGQSIMVLGFVIYLGAVIQWGKEN